MVKKVFSAFNLYKNVFDLLNETTAFQKAAMTEQDFENMNLGKVCEKWTPIVLFCFISIRLQRNFDHMMSCPPHHWRNL